MTGQVLGDHPLRKGDRAGGAPCPQDHRRRGQADRELGDVERCPAHRFATHHALEHRRGSLPGDRRRQPPAQQHREHEQGRGRHAGLVAAGSDQRLDLAHQQQPTNSQKPGIPSGNTGRGALTSSTTARVLPAAATDHT